MANEINSKKPSLIGSVLQCKCPRCRQGELFLKKQVYQKSFMQMHEKCAICGQPYEIEVGFYYGSGYISYALSVALSVTTFIAWWVLIGFSLDDRRVLYWFITNAVLLAALQPILMRLARSGWIALFVHYDAGWRTKKALTTNERLNKNYQNGW